MELERCFHGGHLLLGNATRLPEHPGNPPVFKHEFEFILTLKCSQNYEEIKVNTNNKQ